MTSDWVIRWILVALTAAVALALVLRGNVVIGALLGAVALTRAVLFTRVRRRREELRRRVAERRNARRGPQ
jgi:uncharacterized membrane protein